MKILTLIWIIGVTIMAYIVGGFYTALMPGFTISGYYLMEAKCIPREKGVR